MTGELSILVVGDDRDVTQVLDQVRKVKSVPVHVECVSLAQVEEAVEKIRPQLLIYTANGNLEKVQKAATNASKLPIDFSWVVTSDRADADTILQFFRLGASDFLRQPVQSYDINRIIQKIMDAEERRSAGMKGKGQIAIFSTKGGVGLTTIAANLAVELARLKAGKVLLMDLVLQHGNINDFLDLPAQYTLLDVIENFDRLDSDLLEKSLMKHAAGISVLPCPKQPEDEDFISSNKATEVYNLIKSVYQFIVADVGHEFTKSSIAYLDMADVILLVTTPDVPSLCNTREALSTFRRLGYNPEKIKIVLNRRHMKGEIEPSAIKKNLSIELFTQLPEDSMTCLSAANQGKTIGEVERNCDLAKAFVHFASSVMELVTRKET